MGTAVPTTASWDRQGFLLPPGLQGVKERWGRGDRKDPWACSPRTQLGTPEQVCHSVQEPVGGVVRLSLQDFIHLLARFFIHYFGMSAVCKVVVGSSHQTWLLSEFLEEANMPGP